MGFYWIKEDTFVHSVKTFEVVLRQGDANFLAHMTTSPGNCHTVNTKPKSRRCGLATTLMLYCLKDEDVTRNGGIDLNANVDFQNYQAERELADHRCVTIVYLQCQPEPPTPNSACCAFLDTASIAGYDFLFTVVRVPAPTPGMGHMTLEDAIKNCEDNADGFIRSHGFDWYVCK